jgi:magnesium-transporting ATPase (P-type)
MNNSPVTNKKRPEGLLDWTVLKYGWLIVFLIHGSFLFIGLHFLRQAAYMENPALYTPEQLRISHLLTSTYMVTIAFSLILVILAVFVLEIFRTTQKLLMDVEELREELLGSPPDLKDLADERPSFPDLSSREAG